MGEDAVFGRRAFLVGAGAALAVQARAAEPPVIRRLSPKLDRVLDAGARVETIATGIRWAEGPVWLPRQQALLFTDPPANVIRRWTKHDRVSVFLSPSGAPAFDPKLIREPGANGLALDRSGGLLIANSGGRTIDRLDLVTRRRTTLVARYRGRRFNSPNDMAVARDGAIWFTDPPYGLADGDRSPVKELPHNGVYRWRSGGEPVLVDGTLARPNGVALSSDERRLFVAVSDEAAPRIYAYDLDAKGDARNRRVFLDFAGRPGPGLPDGMKVAADGTMFCTGPGGLHILSREGEPLGLIATGAPVANCALGENGRALFLAADDRVLRVPITLGE
ncbi:SMP-30/gluconolactonase/LRE family protein [Sphingomonas lenta]|uniref:Gluconolactonase n=1 Tax=Sphingomonas lenta TaxID=1141887 RepID=A0A2A2SC36_9SPHN|nr:SMP-30/gluconolactonase/LRE family protein [Sphingomonas lenta]PAX06732.1 gluconolactonase [Sphingomonas lenta]